MFVLKHKKELDSAQRALEKNDYEAAEQDFSKIIEKDAEAIESLLHRALVRLRLGKFEEAIIDADRVVSLRPDHSLGLMIKGEILLEQKKFAEAFDALKKACEIEADNGRAFCGLARACFGLGKKHEGADYLEIALQFERDYTLSQCFAEMLSKG